MKEEWRTVTIDKETYENYEVSNFGNVRSLNYRRTKQVHLLKPKQESNGYLQVDLYKDGKRKVVLVHRLVAYAFLPCEEGKTEINHIDENKQNNHIDNLEWCDRLHNLEHGTFKKRRVEKLSKKVRCVETNIIYNSINDASKDTGIPSGNISACCRGVYRHTRGLHWEFV